MTRSVVRRYQGWSALVIVALVLSACGGTTASSSAPAASTGATSAPAGSASTAPSAASQPYAGTQLTLETYAAVPEFDFYATLMPAFEAQTGIKVNYIQQPVAAQDQKIPLQLTAK